MLTETGQSLEVPADNFVGIDLITAILPHPIHGRLTEFPLLMVNKQINVEGVRYDLVWRDGALAYYRPITVH
jgi:hypothetical protein